MHIQLYKYIYYFVLGAPSGGIFLKNPPQGGFSLMRVEHFRLLAQVHKCAHLIKL